MSSNEKLMQYVALTERRLDELTALRGFDSRVLEAMRYSLLSGGKRIRAALCLASCELCGGEEKYALDAACALEMIHAYSLIHDDLPCMDDDDMRRGKPSCHIKYGYADALLAGDGLLTLAFETLSGIGDSAVSAECAGLLAKAAGARGMVYGQELDLRYEDKEASLSELEQIHLHKTGALIKVACTLGAACAHASKQQKDALCEYAERLGLVFQIIDDILDCTSTDEQLGKPVGSDREQHKNTYVTLLGVERSRELARQYTEQAVRSLDIFEEQKREFLCSLALELLVRKK